MKKLLKIVLVGCVPLFLFSCYYDEFPEEPPVIIDPEIDITFSEYIAPIFETHTCTDCHNANGQSPNLSPGSAYNSLINGGYIDLADPYNSKLYKKLEADTHYRVITEEEKAYIIAWIEDGAQDN